MEIKKIYGHLFQIAKKSKDPEGVVAACIVKNGGIIASAASADDGVRHAEDLVIEKIKDIKIDDSTMLYITLEPCNTRNLKKKIKDCTSLIIDSGIKRVIFAARDPKFSKITQKRLKKAKILAKQIKDEKIIKKAVEIFNQTAKEPLDWKK
jgi:pyrimidine deaminase RibD-like protein